MKLTVLVAAIRVCPGVHMVRELGMILKGKLALSASYTSY